jgi:ankyrin repeat protein/energy-coupling factor transporter ATP-binding protein EcfA2
MQHEQNTVRILGPDNRQVGTGILIGPAQILTCTHVVVAAQGRPDADTAEPGQGINVELPFLAAPAGGPLRALPQLCKPVMPQPQVGDLADIALLRLEDPSRLLAGAAPAALRVLSQPFNREAAAFGFQRWEGDTVRLSLLAMNTSGAVQIEQRPGYPEVGPGFSGAAVREVEDWSVIGMLVRRDRPDPRGPQARTAYMIPAAQLLEVLGDAGITQRQVTPTKTAADAAASARAQTEPSLGARERSTQYEEPDNPYRFLEYYEIGDRIYGRDSQVQAITSAIHDSLSEALPNCFIGIVGSTGCGKTSLLRAGVLTALQQEGHWVVAFRPTDFHDVNGRPANIIRRITLAVLASLTGESIRLQDYNTTVEGASERQRVRRALRLLEKHIKDAPPVDAHMARTLIIGFDQFEDIVDDLEDPERSAQWRELIEFIELSAHSSAIAVCFTLESSRQTAFRKTALDELVRMRGGALFRVSGFYPEFIREVIVLPFRSAGYILHSEQVLAPLLANAENLGENVPAAEADSLLPLLALILSRLFDIVIDKTRGHYFNEARRDARMNFPERNVVDLATIGNPQELDMRLAIQRQAERAWGEGHGEEALDLFLRPFIYIAHPDCETFALRPIQSCWPGQESTFDRFLRSRLIVRDGSRFRLVHKAVLRYWPAAWAWFERETTRLRDEADARALARAWNAEGSQLPTHATASAIDIAAEVLLAYAPYWAPTRRRSLAVDEEAFMRYCLAIFSTSKTPLRMVIGSKAKSLHVHVAALYGMVDLLERFWAIDPGSLHAKRSDGRTPLFHASYYSPKSLAFLLYKNESATAPGGDGWPPLAAAFAGGNLDCYKMLIDRYNGADLVSWPLDWTALHALAYQSGSGSDRVVMAKDLVEQRGVDPDQRASGGATALHVAAAMGNSVLFDYLCRVCDLNARKDNGWNAMHICAAEGHSVLLDRLLGDERLTADARDQRVRVEPSGHYYHALHLAIWHERPETVAILVDELKDPNIPVKAEIVSSETPLHLAAQLATKPCEPAERRERKRVARIIVSTLLRHPNVDPNALHTRKRTALAWARHDIAMAEEILNHRRLDPQLPVERDGPTPVMLSAALRDWTTTQRLIEAAAGASVCVPTKEGRTLLHIVVENGAPASILRRVIAADPAINAQDSRGWTPVVAAAARGDAQTVALLLLAAEEKGLVPEKLGLAALVAIEKTGSIALLETLGRGNPDIFTEIYRCGWNALHIACVRGSEELLEYLRTRVSPALWEVLDGYGRVPLDLAPTVLQRACGRLFREAPARWWDTAITWAEAGSDLQDAVCAAGVPIRRDREGWSLCSVRQSPLPFVDTDRAALVRCQMSGVGKVLSDVFFIAAKTDSGVRLFRLDGTSQGLHAANALVGVTIGRVDVLDYLRFFCFFVRGEGGPFLIVEDVSQLDFAEAVDDRLESQIMRLLRRPHVYHCCEESCRVSATVLYDSAIFLTDFVVHRSGMVSMDSDIEVLNGVPRVKVADLY